MQVAVIGTGYVGLSLSILISRFHSVIAVDIDREKVDAINSGVSTIDDREISEHLASGKLNLKATTDYSKCSGSDFVIIAVPTNYDVDTQYFNTGIIESALSEVKRVCPSAVVIIKSTVPIGYTKHVYTEQGYENVLSSPEFLREGRALYDNLYPSRIVIGTPSDSAEIRIKATEFAELLRSCSLNKNAPILITGSTEAESIKLFSNTYLALRVAYFNELDSYAEQNGLSPMDIISGVCMDPRIGDHYNNPSFGYGGYCLPKDTKQLLANYLDVPNELMGALVRSNDTRKKFVSDRIAKLATPGDDVIGVFRLAMKSNSDNFRESSIIDVMMNLRGRGFRVVIYDPAILGNNFEGFDVIHDLLSFKKMSKVIITNRESDDLRDCSAKVYCRDVFNRD